MTDLICEPNTETEQQTTNDEHPNGGCETVKKSSGAEENSSEKHRKFPAKLTSNVRSNNARAERGEVERGGEESERNAVEFAVFARLLIVLLLLVYGREELLLKRIHSRHTSCKK